MSQANKFQVGWISGMPRSGTTWLSQIFASSPEVRLKSCPLFSYEFKNKLNEKSTAEEWERLFLDVFNTNSEFLDQQHLRKNELVPSFSKSHNPTHLMIKSNRFHHLTPYILKLNQGVRIIHIVRHPCATIHSWLSNTREFPLGSNPLDNWRNGLCRKTGVGEFWGFDDWKKVTTQALRLTEQFPDQHKIIRYEQLLKDTPQYSAALFDFLQLPYSKQTEEFIHLSHSRHDSHQHSVYKNPKLTSQWESLMDMKIAAACIGEVKGTELEQFISE